MGKDNPFFDEDRKGLPKNFQDLIHDIRNPMSVIYTTFEILMIKKWPSDCSEDLLRHIKTCKAQLDRIKMMLSNFADMNRISDMPYSRSDEKILKLLNQVADSFHPRLEIEKKSLKIMSPDIIFGLDRNIFKQLVHNMLEHMLFFTENNSESHLVCSLSEGKLLVEVFYFGGGELTQEEMKLIFDTQERVVDKKNGVKYNKGYGLTYNRRMAEFLGGTMDLIIEPLTLKHTLRLEIT